MPNSRKRKGRNSWQRRRKVEHLILRDGLACFFCGMQMDPKLKHPDPKFITVHHVVPYAIGGHCNEDNLRLAHYDCNWEDGLRIQREKRLDGSNC